MEDEVIIQAIHEELGDVDIERNESLDFEGMKGFTVDGEELIIGDYETAYEAAINEAMETFDSCYSDSDKVDWLQKWNWPGVREEEVCDALADDHADYDEDETVYQPDSINQYIDEMGYSKASDVFSWEFLQDYTNTREIGEFVVDTDGIENSLARYDGEERTFGDFYGYRVE